MGTTLGSQFDLNTNLPLDSRDVKADVTARNAIPSTSRYLGMKVYLLSDKKTYILKDGILDANWEEFASGGGGGGVNTIVTKTASATVLATEDTVLCTPAASMTLTLPVGVLKEIHRFIRTDSVEARTVTIACAGSDTFLNSEGNTATSMTLPFQGQALEIIYIATNTWWAKYL